MIRDTADIAPEWALRTSAYADDHREMDKLVGAYFGVLPSEFDDYFDPEMHVHVINMLRMAWDDLAIRAGKVFPLYVEPDNDTPTARDRAEKQERIALGYNYAGRAVGAISRDLLSKVQAWWMVGCANAVYLTLPSYDKKTPFFTFRDPRTYYPPVGWSPYTQVAADDGLFAYQITVGELRRRYPDRIPEIDQKLLRTTVGYGGATAATNESLVWLGEYYSADSWIIAPLTDQAITLARSDTGDRGHPDVNPITPMGLYHPSGAKGRSLFADQISIQAAMARMFSQKLDFYDRTLYPLVFHTRLTGQTLRVGPFATNEFDASDGVPPRVEVVAPAHQIDADQTMAFAMGMSRMLNRNPESFQGQGRADSAKAISQLEDGPAATIKDGIWPAMLEAEAKIYEVAASLDVNLWGNVKKVAKGSRKNSAFRVNYVPAVDLRGREQDFCVEPGLGLGGYQGIIEILQMLGAEQISEETAIEQREDIRDADKELRRIEADRVKKLMRLQLGTAAQAQPGMPGALQDGALAELLDRIERGERLQEAWETMSKAQRLFVVPPPQPLAPPGGDLGGGFAPPAGVGPGTGGAASFLPLPDLNALRGGPGGVRNNRPQPTG
jgi:hypothetical protein